jgi:hypothetical protein
MYGAIQTRNSLSFIQKDSFNVTVNLRAALSRLRNHSMEQILWVDSICMYSDRSSIKSRRKLRSVL